MLRKEKRKHPRKTCNVTASFEDFDKATGRPVFVETTLKDISESGVRFKSIRFVPVDERLPLKISLPQRKPVESIIKPAWVREMQAIEQYDIGAQFITLTNEDRNLIKSFISSVSTG